MQCAAQFSGILGLTEYALCDTQRLQIANTATNFDNPGHGTDVVRQVVAVGQTLCRLWWTAGRSTCRVQNCGQCRSLAQLLQNRPVVAPTCALELAKEFLSLHTRFLGSVAVADRIAGGRESSKMKENAFMRQKLIVKAVCLALALPA